jgi:hypothetical protein
MLPHETALIHRADGDPAIVSEVQDTGRGKVSGSLPLQGTLQSSYTFLLTSWDHSVTPVHSLLLCTAMAAEAGGEWGKQQSLP